MASLSKKTKAKRKRRHNKAGRARKNMQSRKSTLSREELFAACGEPGQAISAAQG